jgi:hypothetical protein
MTVMMFDVLHLIYETRRCDTAECSLQYKPIPFMSRVNIVTSIIVSAPVRISHGEKVSPVFNQTHPALPAANSINSQTPWKTALALSSLCRTSLTPPPTTSSFLRPKRSLCQRIFSFFSTPIKPLTSASAVDARSKVTLPESDTMGLKPSARTKKSAVLACIICSVDHNGAEWCGMVDGSPKAGARRVRVG